MPDFLEGSAYCHGLSTIMECGTNFGFSSGRQRVVENLGDGVDRAVDRGVSDRWIGRVSGLVSMEVVAIYPDASAGVWKGRRRHCGGAVSFHWRYFGWWHWGWTQHHLGAKLWCHGFLVLLLIFGKQWCQWQ